MMYCSLCKKLTLDCHVRHVKNDAGFAVIASCCECGGFKIQFQPSKK